MNQVGGRGGSEQAEGEAALVGVCGAFHIALANTCEKLIGGKREAARHVYFVHEHHERLRGGGQGQVAQRAEETEHRPHLSMRFPVVYKLGLQSQMASRFGEQSRIPLFRRQVPAAELGQVEKARPKALLFEPGDGARAQRRLAHLSGVEDVAILARKESGKQVGIRLPLHVGARVRRQRAACDVEGSRRGQGSRKGHGKRAFRNRNRALL